MRANQRTITASWEKSGADPRGFLVTDCRESQLGNRQTRVHKNFPAKTVTSPHPDGELIAASRKPWERTASSSPQSDGSCHYQVKRSPGCGHAAKTSRDSDSSNRQGIPGVDRCNQSQKHAKKRRCTMQEHDPLAASRKNPHHLEFFLVSSEHREEGLRNHRYALFGFNNSAHSIISEFTYMRGGL